MPRDVSRTKSIRLRATITFEYDADPDHYGTDNPAEMAKIDSGNDFMDMLILADGGVRFSVEPAP